MPNFVDRYGNYQGEIDSAPGKPVPYIVSKEGEYTYICYTNDALRLIQRVHEYSSGGAQITVIENGYGAWEDRATLDYYPPNVAVPIPAV